MTTRPKLVAMSCQWQTEGGKGGTHDVVFGFHKGNKIPDEYYIIYLYLNHKFQ